MSIPTELGGIIQYSSGDELNLRRQHELRHQQLMAQVGMQNQQIYHDPHTASYQKRVIDQMNMVPNYIGIHYDAAEGKAPQTASAEKSKKE